MPAENPLGKVYNHFAQAYSPRLAMYDQQPSGIFTLVQDETGNKRYLTTDFSKSNISFDVREDFITRAYQKFKILRHDDPSYRCDVEQEITDSGLEVKLSYENKTLVQKSFDTQCVHTIQDGVVTNEVIISINAEAFEKQGRRHDGVSILTDTNFTLNEKLERGNINSFVFDSSRNSWFLRTNSQGNVTNSTKRYTSEELREFGVDCVPTSVNIDGPLMNVEFDTGDKTIVYQIPSEVPGSIVTNIVNGRPMIPFNAIVTEKATVPQ